MTTPLEQHLLRSPLIGFAHHRIVLDEEGKPVDYEFLEMNESFERLTGLKREDVLHKTVVDVLPGIREGDFDWIAFYGEVALGAGEREFEQYSEPLGRWYRVHVYSAERMFFTTLFLDITEDRRTMDALRQSESRFRSTFENSPLGMIRFDEEGTIRDCNEKFVEMMGSTREKLIGFNTARRSSPEMRKALRTALGGQPSVYENEYTSVTGGTKLFLRVSFNPITPGQDPTGVIAALEDITERRREEEQRNFQLELQQVVAEASSLLTGVSNDKEFDEAVNLTLEILGELFDVDRAYLFRFSDDMTLMSNTHEWCAPSIEPRKERIRNHPTDSMPWWKERIQQRISVHLPDVEALPPEAETEKREFQAQGIRSLLCLPTVGAQGVLGGFIGFDAVRRACCWSDDQIVMLRLVANAIGSALERREAEDALRESEERFDLAINGIGAGLWDWDMVKNTVFFSPRWKKMLGYEDHEVANAFSGWKDLWHPDDAARVESAVNAYLEGRTAVYEIEHRLRHKDGSWRWILTRGDIQKDAAGKSLRWTGTNMDVTDRKRAEEELVRAKEKAEAASVAKSEFLANMSHEIRTPMNGVLGMTELLLDTTLDEEQRRFAETVRSSAESLLEILNDILDFSKVEAGKLELKSLDFSLSTLLDGFGAVMSASAERKGLVFHASLPSDVPLFLRGDPWRLRQILTNLTGNAVKFTQEGEVRVAVALENQSMHYVLLRFTVRDTGIGIPADKVGSLFQKFMQVDASSTRVHGGTGLGLAISKQLAEMMGGAVGVESEEGKGSEFWFTVCVEKQPEGACRDELSGGGTLAAPRFEMRGARLLLVEDNAVNRSVALGLLKKLGLSADTAEDGEKALAALEKQEYDLVLMDCQMPVMDGYEATKRIRLLEGAKGKTPVAAMTAHAMSGDREKCIESGMDDYLSKPISRSALVKVLDTWLPGREEGRARDENEARSVFAGSAPEAAATRIEAPTAEEVVFDESHLLRLLSGDREMAGEVVAEFLEDTLHELAALAGALASGDIGSVKQHAHTIKGSAANVGGTVLRSVAFDVEKAARAGDMHGAAVFAAKLEREFERLKQAMRNMPG